MLGVPLAAGVLYPAFGLLLSPMFASAAMIHLACVSFAPTAATRSELVFRGQSGTAVVGVDIETL